MSTDLGPFSICVPRDWKLKRRGIDSAAGRFESGRLKVGFDFGLNADPLQVVEGSLSMRESQVMVDGRPARHVTYRTGMAPSTPTYFSGVHVPAVRTVSQGSLKLTVLAHSPDASDLDAAEKAFSTIRFQGAQREGG